MWPVRALRITSEASSESLIVLLSVLRSPAYGDNHWLECRRYRRYLRYLPLPCNGASDHVLWPLRVRLRLPCELVARAVNLPTMHVFLPLQLFDYILTASQGKAEVSAVTYQHKSPTDFKTYHVRPTHPPRHGFPNTPTVQNVSAYPEYYNGRQTRSYRRRRSLSIPNRDNAVLQRRHVYRNKLYSLHIGANRVSQYRNWTPQMVADSPELQSRARMWIRRELRVFSFLNAEPSDNPARAATTTSNAEFLLAYIISILKSIDIKASDGKAEDLLQEFLGRENARLFLHELNAWLRSPYTKVEDWDRHVQYAEQLPTEFDADRRPARRRKNTRASNRSRSPNMDRARGRMEGESWRNNTPD